VPDAPVAAAGLQQSHAHSRFWAAPRRGRRGIADGGGVARKLDLLVVDAIGKEAVMLKFLGTTMGIIFLIGLLVVIGLFALIF
jgi:hypothetical protein